MIYIYYDEKLFRDAGKLLFDLFRQQKGAFLTCWSRVANPKCTVIQSFGQLEMSQDVLLNICT